MSARAAKRDWLLTATGTRYTYVGWVRAYNAALKSSGSGSNLAYNLAGAYQDYYNKHTAQMRAEQTRAAKVAATRERTRRGGRAAKSMYRREITQYEKRSSDLNRFHLQTKRAVNKLTVSELNWEYDLLAHWELPTPRPANAEKRMRAILNELRRDAKAKYVRRKSATEEKPAVEKKAVTLLTDDELAEERDRGQAVDYRRYKAADNEIKRRARQQDNQENRLRRARMRAVAVAHTPSGKPATRKPAKKKPENKEPKRESMTMGVRRSRESPYHTPPQYIEHWEASVAQAHSNMARPKRELPVLKSELKHFQRLTKEYPDNDYYPVAIASNRRQIASHLDRIRAEQDQLRYLAKHKPTAYLDKARYMREKRARARRDK